MPEESKIIGNGELASLIRDRDWRQTPLGPLSGWSETLLGVVNQILNSPLPTIIFWGQSFTLFYNDAYRPFCSTKHPASLGSPGRETWQEVWHLVGPNFERVFSTGEPDVQKCVMVPIEQDGRMQDFFWDFSISALYENGRIAGCFQIPHNITAEVLANRERDTLAARLEQVLDVTSDGVISIDRNWKITFVNQQARQIIAPSGEVLGLDLWQAFPALNRPSSPFAAHLRSAMYEGISSEVEAFYPDPLNIWVRVILRPAPDGIVLFFRDTTAERVAEDALRSGAEALAASEEELRWTVDLSLQIPWTADPEGNILSFSDAWMRLTGLQREEGLGGNWARSQHPDDLPGMAKAWSLSLASGEPFDFEHRLLTRTGEYRWMRTRARPRYHPGGAILKWYGSTEDIHERKQAEAALMQTEKLAVVGRLAASIAHEINNPLEAVTNLLYLARTGDELAEIHQHLDLAELELRRVAAITTQTLRFHRQSTSPTSSKCVDLIGDALSIFGSRLHQANVEVRKRKRANSPILCFEGEIRQVLSNLIGNAIDAMTPHGGRLLLRSRESTHWRTGRKGLTLTVADTGSGISAKTRKNLFEPFFTTKGIAGTGLGLWISTEIVRRHGGALQVRSSQNHHHQGTVFTLFLPFNAVTRTG